MNKDKTRLASSVSSGRGKRKKYMYVKTDSDNNRAGGRRGGEGGVGAEVSAL